MQRFLNLCFGRECGVTMEITRIHETKLKVVLTAEDMENLSLDYDDMDYAQPATREALLYLLEKGREETGFHPKKSKLVIEVYPCEGGGCVLYFMVADKTRNNERSGIRPAVFAFDTADDLIEGACRLFQQYGHRIYKSSLYRLDREYRLVVYPLDYTDRLSVYFLSEYARLVGEGELLAAFTEEHGQALVVDNAIDIIAQHFVGK